MGKLDSPPTLPNITDKTEVRGVFASDLIIRTALLEAIKDIRRNPWLLDWCFASLLKDPLTLNEYGQKEIDEAKKWFLHTEIPVFMSTRIDDVKMPAISIHLASSAEDAATLSDVHYQVSEEVDTAWPALAGPLTPLGYESPTGRMNLDGDDLEGLVLVPGMLTVDRTGKVRPILEVQEDNVIIVEPGVVDFRDMLIKGGQPKLIADIESVICKETYQIGCHVNTKDVHLIYLHSIVAFALFRYKETLLEARGLERSIIQSMDHSRNHAFDNELAFSRFISLTGYVRQSWPKVVQPAIAAVQPRVVATEGNVPISNAPLAEQVWVGDEDPDSIDAFGNRIE
jgi:hypothetical protein